MYMDHRVYVYGSRCYEYLTVHLTSTFATAETDGFIINISEGHLHIRTDLICSVSVAMDRFRFKVFRLWFPVQN